MRRPLALVAAAVVMAAAGALPGVAAAGQGVLLGGLPIAVQGVGGGIVYLLVEGRSGAVRLERSAGGGVRFSDVPLPAGGGQPVALGFTGARTGIVATESRPCRTAIGICRASLWATTSGGRRWRRLVTIGDLAWTTLDVRRNSVWAVGRRANCFARDCPRGGHLAEAALVRGGWQAQVLAPVPPLEAVARVGALDAAGVGSDGAFYVTSNGGRSWQRRGQIGAVTPRIEVTVAAHPPENWLVSVCNAAQAFGGGCVTYLWGSADGGRRWRLLYRHGGSERPWLWMTGERRGVLLEGGVPPSAEVSLGTDVVLRTADGGRRWHVGQRLAANVRAAWFGPGGAAWVAGQALRCEVPPACPIVVLRSSDGGRRWQVLGEARAAA